MTNTIEFHFDFGSPNAYLAHLRIQDLQKDHDIRFTYVPILLGGIFKSSGNQSPIIQAKDSPNKQSYLQQEVIRFIKRFGYQKRFVFNSHFPVNTLMTMRGAIAAQSLEERVYTEYVNTVFEAIWLKDLKMDEQGVIYDVLDKAELPVDKLLELSQTTEIKNKLIENTANSVDRGSFGSPSFYLGDELFFGKETLSEILERCT